MQASSVRGSDWSMMTGQRATLKKESRCGYSNMSVAGSFSEHYNLFWYEGQFTIELGARQLRSDKAH